MNESGGQLPLVVYDTNIVLQATLSPQSVSEKSLSLIKTGRVAAILSNRLRSEYEDVLRRLSLRGKYKRLLGEEIIAAQLERIDALMHRVPNPPEQIEYPRDAKDAPLINLAIFYDARFAVCRHTQRPNRRDREQGCRL